MSKHTKEDLKRRVVSRALRGHPVHVRSAEGRYMPVESRRAAADALRRLRA